jgi:DNA-binding transcriptional LysR family regulator
MGVAVLPELVVAAELERGVLVALPWPQKPIYVYTQLIRHRDKWFSSVMQAFWTMAEQLLCESERLANLPKQKLSRVRPAIRTPLGSTRG